jgi:hypothetical protein
MIRPSEYRLRFLTVVFILILVPGCSFVSMQKLVFPETVSVLGRMQPGLPDWWAGIQIVEKVDWQKLFPLPVLRTGFQPGRLRTVSRLFLHPL